MSDADDLGLTGLDDDFNLVDQIDIEQTASIKERHERAAAVIRSRKDAFVRLFVAGNPMPGDVGVIMGDLEYFCRGKRSTFNANPYVGAMLEGRREVLLRINEYLDLSVDELVKLKL